MCLRPIFSPDGSTIAYTVRELGDPPLFSIRLVPAGGGEARTIYSDSLAAVAMSWAPDGQALYVLGDDGESYLSLMSLDGKILKSYPRPGLARFLSVSPDGKEFLYSVFNKDNWELALLPTGAKGEPEILAETPAWETGGCFGPRPGDVTVVSRSVFGAPTNEFFIWSPGTREFKPLPLPKARNDMPAWSRDGRYLAYTTNQTGHMNLWVLDMTGGRSVEITSGADDDSRPDWSPDGRSIVFLRGSRTSHIFVADPKTRAKRQVTSGETYDFDPMVSPDGKWVAFSRENAASGKSGEYLLAWAPVAGGPVHAMDLHGLTYNASGGVSWSPDASQLAFAADDGSGNIDIYRVFRDGGVPARVTVAPGTDVIPIWSSDGRTIGYTRAAGGETEVWTIPSGGGVPTQISSGDGVNQLSYFSPDDRWITYMRVLPDGTYDLRVSELGRRGEDRALLHADKVIYPMGWSSDGRYVVAWQMEAERPRVTAIATDGSGNVDVGEVVDEPDGKGFFVNLTPKGEAFAGVVYPGGVNAFQYGDNVTDVYLVHVADLLSAGAPAAQAGGAR